MDGKEPLFWEQFIFCNACQRLLLATGKTYEVWHCERCGTPVAMGIDFMCRKQTAPFPLEVI